MISCGDAVSISIIQPIKFDTVKHQNRSDRLSAVKIDTHAKQIIVFISNMRIKLKMKPIVLNQGVWIFCKKSGDVIPTKEFSLDRIVFAQKMKTG